MAWWVGCCLGHLHGAAGFNICLRGSGFEPFDPSAHGGNFGYSHDFEGPENGILKILILSGITKRPEKAPNPTTVAKKNLLREG
jgi:hypothetical protein